MSKRFLAGLGLLAAFLGAAIGPLAHLALVPHVRCAQHGELVHQTAAITHAALPAGDAPAASDDGTPEREEHDHCLVQASPRALRGPDVPRLEVASLLRPKVEGAALPAQVAVELLQLAPKSSPPFAA